MIKSKGKEKSLLWKVKFLFQSLKSVSIEIFNKRCIVLSVCKHMNDIWSKFWFIFVWFCFYAPISKSPHYRFHPALLYKEQYHFIKSDRQTTYKVKDCSYLEIRITHQDPLIWFHFRYLLSISPIFHACMRYVAKNQVWCHWASILESYWLKG